ncbi:hypothetical protein [Krasilnikovia sp. MM14-A1259]|uniref:hypothetical protein n=1 Tax=Krasilnikovia sp. MM14-A1259 TaxID=3373539 RepID=UPI00399C61EA
MTVELHTALVARFEDRWDIGADADGFRMVPRRRTLAGRRRSCPSPAQLLDGLRRALAGVGLRVGDALLPQRWNRDTDLTISAVQALDPWLKDRSPFVWREGFLAQPVVRFTGSRAVDGRLEDGYLTSFANVSYVQRVGSADDHVRLLDGWLSALSAIGIHAGRLTIHGSLRAWQRPPVSGITLFIDCDGRGLGDAVLLWNTTDRRFMATDIGSGLERLRWLLGARTWSEAAFGDLGSRHDLALLDATRTAVLLIMAGIKPGPRGVGSALRSVAQDIDTTIAATGLGRIVREHHRYWNCLGLSGTPWPHTATRLEAEVLRRTRPSSGYPLRQVA